MITLLYPATFDDADILLEWRNDLETRQASRNMDLVDKSSHIEWLKASLANPNRKIYIAYHPVGTIRWDLTDNFYELSWTVAPDMRKQGIGRNMVSALVKELDAPVCAKVKPSNTASIKIAQYAGMVFDKFEGDLIVFRSKDS